MATNCPASAACARRPGTSVGVGLVAMVAARGGLGRRPSGSVLSERRELRTLQGMRETVCVMVAG